MADPKMSAEDKKWRAEMDAQTLANADAIRTDPKRTKAAGAAATRLVAQEKKQAAEAQKRAQGMERVAKAKGKVKPAPAPKPRAKARPAARAKPRRR